MAREILIPGFGRITEDEEKDVLIPGFGRVHFDQAAAPVGGRIMSSLAGSGGLAYKGGIAGPGGGLAG